MTIAEFQAEVADLFQTGVRKGISAADLRQAFNDLSGIVGGNAQAIPTFLPAVTGLTGGGATKLDGAIPDGLTYPCLFSISPPTAITDIGLPADGMAIYKLRAAGGDVADGYNKIQPTNSGYASALLVKVG